ncbi:MAG: hypothetical protein HY753_01290, partial [Nitrospirae bacterium]|nr:hypothetical protein [Nitrospirota bacterium]
KASEKEAHNPNIVGLRRLNHFCYKRILETDNKEERFLCFYISKFSDSFFANLGGDAPYDKELQKARIDLISAIQDKLDILIKAIKDTDNKKLFSTLCDLVDHYIDTINFVNNVPCP